MDSSETPTLHPLSPKEIEQLTASDIHVFNEYHGIRTETGERLDFRDHLFLFDIYSDWSEKLVCYKAAQIGFTTMAINKSLYAAKNHALEIIYTLPTDGDRDKFVTSKVNRIIQQNPVYQAWVKDHDTVAQKRVGGNVIYFQGTFTERAALMIASDLNIHDEEDRSNQENIAQYASRQQHSKKKWEWHFSNPSVEGNGVSKYWRRSDQKHWFVRCQGPGSCGHEQYLSWPESLDMEKRTFVCKACARPLTREDRRVGRWRKKKTDYAPDFSGYWISLLMAPWTTADQIIAYYNDKPADYFWNFVLGLPYIGDGNIVDPEAILRNCAQWKPDEKGLVIGCDSGLKKHWVMGNAEGLQRYGVAKDWSEIEALLRRHSDARAVIDALPDLTEPRKLRERFPGRVFLCHYARDRKTMQIARWGRGNEEGSVTVDRNRALQLVIDEFADGRIPLLGRADDWQWFVEHWKTLFKVVEPDALGVPVFRWETSNGNDHFAHAAVYWRVGMDRFAAGGGVLASEDTFDLEGMKKHPSIAPDGRIEGVKLEFPATTDPEDWRRP